MPQEYKRCAAFVHLMTPENTLEFKDGRRYCKECRHRNQAQYRIRSRMTPKEKAVYDSSFEVSKRLLQIAQEDLAIVTERLNACQTSYDMELKDLQNKGDRNEF